MKKWRGGGDLRMAPGFIIFLRSMMPFKEGRDGDEHRIAPFCETTRDKSQWKRRQTPNFPIKNRLFEIKNKVSRWSGGDCSLREDHQRWRKMRRSSILKQCHKTMLFFNDKKSHKSFCPLFFLQFWHDARGNVNPHQSLPSPGLGRRILAPHRKMTC